MKLKELAIKLIDKTKEDIDKFLRNIDEVKRQEIAKDYESTVKFLMRKNKKGKNLTWLDEIKYLERNPFVDSVRDVPTPFTKGREHKLVVRLVQSNYRIKKNGEIFKVDEVDSNRLKAYEFVYSYYKPIQEKDDTSVKLYYMGFNLDGKFDASRKVFAKLN